MKPLRSRKRPRGVTPGGKAPMTNVTSAAR
jgi:hypothetical protein